MSEIQMSRRGFVSAAATVAAPGSVLAATAASASAATAQNSMRREPVTGPEEMRVPVLPQGDPIVIVTQYQFEPHEIRQIQEAAEPTEVEIVIAKDRNEFIEKLGQAEVVYGALRPGDIDRAMKMKWLQNGGAGMESAPEDLMQSDVVITNYAGTFAPGISETAMGLLLSLTRGIRQHYIPQFQRREWKPLGSPKTNDHVELEGRVMGIVGMGGIGQAIARRAHYGFDMVIVGTDAEPMHKPHFVAELHDPTWLMQMVPMVDVLVTAAPETKHTRKMINEEVFRAMKKTAYFLAMSRGTLYDDMALVKALKEKWIAGAGLDVFPQEPAPSDHPIFEFDNVVMSMHTSGWSPDRQIRLIALFADNVRRYARGLPLINVVNKQAGW